jgi:hypothetical protein
MASVEELGADVIVIAEGGGGGAADRSPRPKRDDDTDDDDAEEEEVTAHDAGRATRNWPAGEIISLTPFSFVSRSTATCSRGDETAVATFCCGCCSALAPENCEVDGNDAALFAARGTLKGMRNAI